MNGGMNRQYIVQRKEDRICWMIDELRNGFVNIYVPYEYATRPSCYLLFNFFSEYLRKAGRIYKSVQKNDCFISSDLIN